METTQTPVPKALSDKLPKNVLYELYTFLTPPKYKLQGWIDANIQNMDLAYLAKNPKMMTILEKNIDLLDDRCWYEISKNRSPEAVALLSQNTDKLNRTCWISICSNPQAIDLVKENTHVFNERCWRELCGNSNPKVLTVLLKNSEKSIYFDFLKICDTHKIPEVLSLLERNVDSLPKECWRILSRCDFALLFLELHQDNACWFDWRSLSANGNAMTLIKNNLNFVITTKLASNPNPEAIVVIEKILEKDPQEIDTWTWSNICLYARNIETIVFLEKNMNKLDEGCWYHLSKNKYAIPLLSKYPDKVNWGVLAENEGIYIVDEDLLRVEINKKIK